MYHVTVDGETMEWVNFEYALRDVMLRGITAKEWSMEKLPHIPNVRVPNG